VIPGVQDKLRRSWSPRGFLQRFGAEQVQMIDCRDGKSVHWLTLAHFFAGYLQPWTRALCPDTFRRMMLKLKDWPPDQDFQGKMPEYFEDLMQALPVPQYTHRDGVLNLAKYFPRQYVPPDLGPKMYNAYGRHASWRGMDPATKKGGHTNLHCDVSDAVNVMVDVGFDEGENDSDEEDEGLLLHDDELGELSSQHGAIWDIYRWEDTEAILKLLHAVARERDIEITNNPVHDQLFYLDDTLRKRLRDQYGVRGWRFVQRHGDAIFIPAGCPHQVRNLSSCVKVALDFVSPENAHRCVQLTDQFAKLPRGHHLSEDKLQVKTMLLHALHHISDALLRTGAAAKASVEIANAERAATARAEALKAARQASRQLYAAKRKAAKEAELAAAANAEGSVAEGTVEERVAAAVVASAVEAALDAVFGADAPDEVDDEAMLMEDEAQPVEKPMVYTTTPAQPLPQPPLEQATPKPPQQQPPPPPPPPLLQPPQATQTAAGVMSTTSTTTTTMEVDDETVLLMCSGE